MTHARHAAPGHAAKVAGRIALGVVGAPVALFAAAGPANAADLGQPMDGAFAEAASDATPSAVSLPALPDLASTLPDLIGFELPSVPGLDALSGADVLPSADSLPAPSSTDEAPTVGKHHLAPLVSIDVNVPGPDALPALPALPSADSLPSLPGPDSLPGLESLPGTDSLPGLDSLPGADSLPSTDAVASTAGLITGLI